MAVSLRLALVSLSFTPHPRSVDLNRPQNQATKQAKQGVLTFFNDFIFLYMVKKFPDPLLGLLGCLVQGSGGVVWGGSVHHFGAEVGRHSYS